MGQTISTEPVFTRRQKVVAAVDLPGVPAGTPGRVLYVAGVTWIRYHVLFDGDIDRANLDASQLADRKEWARRQRDEEQARLEAERAEDRARRREEALANLADRPGAH